jgi:murein DD-endopeptidase MepM/ murein hydrolase activator NlpD
VSTADILKANSYKGPRALQPGQQLIIPPRAVAAAPAAAAPKPVAAAPVAAPPSVHVVNRGDTLLSIAHRNHVPVAELAKANGIDSKAKLKLGQKITVPGAKSAAAPAAAQPAVAAGQPAAVAAPATKVAAATAEPASKEKARLAQATTTPEAAVTEAPVKTAEATGALPTFRWPVRGRVVTGYGAKTNGKSNDGINVAVPEGTPVKAAEDGVVAYSGNELKGYGNLILVRHSNGYVTAYAHASELLVKRGETIKRGQIIAKSGQSGEVGSPQLHFEIRKGSSPVDPLQFLNGA